MEPVVTTEKPAEQAPDLKTEMKQFLEKEEAPAEKQEAGTETESDKPDEEAKADEQEEDSEGEKEEDSKEDEKKRPNRYQKQKAKIDALEVMVKKHSSDVNEAVKIANIYRNRFKQAVERLQQIEHQVKSGQYQPNAHEEENWMLKSRQQEEGYKKEIEKQQQQEQAKQEILYAKQEMAEGYRSEALGLAKQFGLVGPQGQEFAKKVLKAYAFSLKAGESDSMKDIASTLATVSKQKRQGQLEREHLDNNRSAPSPIRTGTGRVPSYDLTGDYDKDRKQMKAFVESLKGK